MQTSDSNHQDAQFVSQLTAVQLPMLLYVRSLLPRDSGARDVVQQANIRIWEKRSEFQPGTNFKAWAFQFARFEVLNFRKQQSRDARLQFSQELERTIETELSDSDDLITLRHDAFRQCLETLHQQDQDLLMHRYSDAGTLAEFARRVGRSVAGLRVSLHRLRSSLLMCIERRMQAEEVTE